MGQTVLFGVTTPVLRLRIHDQLKSPLFRMAIVVFVMGALGLWQIDFVIEAINSNVYLNTTILVVFFFGTLIVFRCTFSLEREYLAMTALRFEMDVKRKEPDPDLYDAPATVFRTPPLMGPTFDLLCSQILRSHGAKISASTMTSVLDGVAGRIFDREGVIQYVVGLLVLLGLIGTFVGLLQTLSSVGQLLGGLDLSGDANMDEVFPRLIGGLKEPLVGMGTAFSSSLMGLLTSLTLGLLALFNNSANSNFMVRFESWLTEMTDLSEQAASGLSGVAGSGAGGVATGASGDGFGKELLQELVSGNRLSADINHNLKMLYLAMKETSATLLEKSDLQLEATREATLNLLNSQDQIASQINVFHETYEKSTAAGTAFQQLSAKNLRHIHEQMVIISKRFSEADGSFIGELNSLSDQLTELLEEERTNSHSLRGLLDQNRLELGELLSTIAGHLDRLSVKEAGAHEELTRLLPRLSESIERHTLVAADPATADAIKRLEKQFLEARASVSEGTDMIEDYLGSLEKGLEVIARTNLSLKKVMTNEKGQPPSNQADGASEQNTPPAPTGPSETIYGLQARLNALTDLPSKSASQSAVQEELIEINKNLADLGRQKDSERPEGKPEKMRGATER